MINSDSVLNFLIDCDTHKNRINEAIGKFATASNRPIRKVILHVTPEGARLRLLVDRNNIRNNLLPKNRFEHMLEKEGYTFVKGNVRRAMFEAPIDALLYGHSDAYSDRNDLKRVEKHARELWAFHRKGLSAQRDGLRRQIEHIPVKDDIGEKVIKVTFERTN